MKLNKKILSTALASTMVLGSMSTAFAAVPAGSILLGDKAFKLEYLTEEHSDEINNAFEAGGFDFKYKDYDGTWVDGLNNAIDPATLPAVEFKNVDGSTTNYEAGDGDEVSETATIESVEAITTTKLRVKFSNKIDGANSANFAIDGLTVTNASIQADMQTVDITTSAITPVTNYTLTATGIMVGGEAQEVMTKMFTSPSISELYSGTQLIYTEEDGVLEANGEAATTVTFELRDGEGNLIEDAGDVIVEFTSTFGKFAENRVTVENGKAEVLFVSTTLTSTQTALLRGTIVDATDKNLINIEAQNTIELNPNPDTGGDVTLGARITDAEAAQADRVYVYFDKEVTPEMYLDENGAVDANKAEFKVYNDTTNTNELFNVVGILPIKDNSKGLQLLLDTDNATIADKEYLTANSMVKVELTDKTGNVNLDSNDTFKFTDKIAPEIATASVEGLTKLRVVFTEAISSRDDEIVSTVKDMSAETIANWTIDNIRLDNAKWGEATAATAKVVGFTDGEDKRHIVEITLGTDADGDQIYFTPGLHSVQGSNMGDWAAVTDINALNRLNTQSIDFNVEADETKPVPTVEVQSPEQWLVNFNSPVKTDANFTDMIKLEKYNATSGQWETASNSAVMNNLLDNDKLDIVVTEIKDSSNLVTSILVETDLDWTNVYETPSTLENYYQDKYRLSISAAAVTNPSNGLANDAALLSLSGSIMENDDDKSPETTSIVEASDAIKTANTVDKSQQAYVATISEPIKLRTDNVTANEEGATDSAYAGYTNTDNWNNISKAKAQFLRTSDKKTYAGEVLAIVDEFDKEVLIVPVDENGAKVNLPAGEWKLTLTGLEDDVRNTISTKGEFFTVEGQTVEESEFEILWMYDDLDGVADDLPNEEAYIRNTGVANDDANDEEDAVYVKFSKPVRTSGDGRVDNAKFTLNGAQLPQGAYVRANIEGYDDHDNVTDSVTIMLPDGTISKTGNTIIQVSPEIKSTEGEKVKNPGEHILPYMWTSMTVTDANSLQDAIDDSKVRTINIAAGSNIGNVTIDRLVDVNIAGAITGTLTVDAQETGKMVLNAAAAATIDDVVVDAPNADFVVGANVTVNNTLTINDLYSNSLENNGVINELAVNDDTSIVNKGNITTITVEKNKEVELTVDGGNVPTLEGEGTIKGNGDGSDLSKVLDARAVSTSTSVVATNLVVTFAEELPTGVNVEYSVDNEVNYIAGNVANNAIAIPSNTVADKVYFKYTSGAESVTEVVYGN